MEQLSRPHSLQYPEGTHIADLTNQACINHVAIFVGSLLVHCWFMVAADPGKSVHPGKLGTSASIRLKCFGIESI